MERSPGDTTRSLALLIVLALAGGTAALSGCAARREAPRETPGLRRFDYDSPALGTRFHVTFFAPDPASAAAASNAIFARLASLEAALATDRADSELSRLCAGAGGPARKLGDDLFNVLELAQRVSKLSDGAFDATAEPYLALWRRADEIGAAPAEQQLEVVRPLVGWKKLRLDPIERTAALEVPGMRLEPGGLSLGYAADRVLEELTASGLGRAFIETDVGPFGRVRRFGAPPPGQAGWGLQLEPPAGSRSPAPPASPVANAAIASSPPDALVDPLTGKRMPKPPVVVLARTSAAASALSAAAAVLGRERGESAARAAGATALFDPPAGAPAPSADRRRGRSK
jgi:FAD:protein FMN transferase